MKLFVIAIPLRSSCRNYGNKRRGVIREWIRIRPQFGAYYQPVQELRLADSETQRYFLHMDMSAFDELLRLVGPRTYDGNFNLLACCCIAQCVGI